MMLSSANLNDSPPIPKYLRVQCANPHRGPNNILITFVVLRELYACLAERVQPPRIDDTILVDREGVVRPSSDTDYSLD